MKSFFLGVCLINLVLFFWNIRNNPPSTAEPEASGLPAILLEDEYARARRGVEISGFIDKQAFNPVRPNLPQQNPKPVVKPGINKPKPKPVETKTAALKCYEFGPFPEEQAAQAWMQQHSYQAELVKKPQIVPTNFTVYYPFDKNPEQMRIAKMMLNAKGINDFWAISTGELKGALSLGVFNDLARAETFKNQLQQRGVQVEIKERGKNQLRTFVRIKTAQPVVKPLDGIMSVVCGN